MLTENKKGPETTWGIIEGVGFGYVYLFWPGCETDLRQFSRMQKPANNPVSQFTSILEWLFTAFLQVHMLIK